MPPDRREDILRAAAELFATQGYHPTTVADIAREAQVAQGTLYLYFDSKKAVFSALIDKTLALFKELLSYATQAARDLTAAELQERLPGVYAHILGLCLANRTLVRLMLTEVRGADPELQARLSAFYSELVEEISRHLERGALRGLYRPDLDPNLAAQCLIAIMERCAALILAQEEPDIGHMATHVANFQLNGILAEC